MKNNFLSVQKGRSRQCFFQILNTILIYSPFAGEEAVDNNTFFQGSPPRMTVFVWRHELEGRVRGLIQFREQFRTLHRIKSHHFALNLQNLIVVSCKLAGSWQLLPPSVASLIDEYHTRDP